jgi:hypothetical protein
VATTASKRGSPCSELGRPAKGALSSFSLEIVKEIDKLKGGHTGWGAISILDELQKLNKYPRCELPSVDSINRYFRQKGLVKSYAKHGQFPKQRCPDAEQAHDLWEMDAQGAVLVENLGYHANINIKDNFSLTYCMTFPVSVKNYRTQPRTIHYKYACRSSFEQFGMPKAIQVDKDSVFYENTSKSPFPTPFHLWLQGLGIQMCIIRERPPSKQAVVERSHQTMEKQVLQDKDIKCWKELYARCNERRERLNYHIPCSSLKGRAPLEAHPEAGHSGRPYSAKQEYELFDEKRIHQFLGSGEWYRLVSRGKTISLGGKVYYLKEAKPKAQLQITYCAKDQELIFRDDSQKEVGRKKVKGITAKELIGQTTKELKSTMYKLNHRRDCIL